MKEQNRISYCPHCGVKYPDDGDVCVKCGRKADKKAWSSFKWYMHKREKDNYAESFADYILGKLNYAMNIVITLGVVVTGATAVYTNREFDYDANYLVSYHYMSYSYGERDSFDSFAAMADSKYSVPEHHVVYDYCKNSEPWTMDVFALVFFDDGIYNSVHYTYYGPGTNKNFKLIGTLDKVMIGNKTYVADDRECYKIDRLLFGEACSKAMAEDYVGHILNEDKIYWYQSTIKESEYGPVANYYKKTQDKSKMSLISDIDLNTDRIKKVYVFDIEGKSIGELIFDYIDECPVIVEDRKSQMSIEQAQEIADNFKVYTDKLRGETYGEN